MTDTTSMLSIVIPVYNGAPFIAETILNIYDAMPPYTWEVIVVNDGSADGTRSALESLAGSYPTLRVLHLPRNMGKGHAIKAGLREARGPHIVFTDADLPYGAESINRMAEVAAARPHIGLAYGSRSHPASREEHGYGIVRRFGRVFFSAVARGLVAKEVRDTQCGVKMLSRPFAERVLKLSSVERFAFDVELFAIASALHIPSEAVPVSLNHRKESSIRIVRDTLGMMRDILRIRRNMKRGVFHRTTQPPYHPTT